MGFDVVGFKERTEGDGSSIEGELERDLLSLDPNLSRRQDRECTDSVSESSDTKSAEAGNKRY